MIKDTYSQCVIKSVSVTKTTALIKLVISSIKDQDKDLPFKFFIKDEDGVITELSNVTYWIDRLTGFVGDNSVININKYKELIFSIDITRQNQSIILDKKWYRKLKIILINAYTNQIAWNSEWLELLSKEIEIPQITNVDIVTNKDYETTLSLKYSYNSQSDFNYNNAHLYTLLNVKSIFTGEILESARIDDEDNLYSTITYTFTKAYGKSSIATENVRPGDKIIIEVILKTSDNKTVTSEKYFYTPIPRASNTWVIINGKARKVRRIYYV